MTTAGTGPRVYFGFGSTWRTEDGDISWTDVTEYVNDRQQLVSVFRGATSTHGKAGAGTVDLTLNNPARRFDPLHAAGPHFGDLVPGVPVLIGYSINDFLLDADGDPLLDSDDEELGASELIQVGRGMVKSWPQSPAGSTFTYVKVHAVDGSQNLARAPIPSSVYDLEVLADNPKAYWKLDDDSGSPIARDLSPNGFDGRYRNEPERVTDGLVFGSAARRFDQELLQAVDFDDAAQRISTDPDLERSFSIEAWIRTSSTPSSEYDIIYRQAGDAGGSILQFVLDDSGAIVFGWYHLGVGQLHASASVWNDGDTHHVVGKAVFPGLGVYDEFVFVDGENDNSTATFQFGDASTAVSIGGHPNPRTDVDYFDGLISHVAIYEHELSDARIAAHYQAGTAPWAGDTVDERLARLLDIVDWPTDLRDLSTGVSPLGPAVFSENDRALSYFRELETTEDGRIFISRTGKLTFQDRHWPFTADEATTSQFTFTDDQTAGGCYADFDFDPGSPELVLNAFRYSRRNGSDLRGQDDDSIADYGFREDSQSNLLLGSDNEVRARGQWTLLTRATPQPQVNKIRVPLHTYSDDDIAAVLRLDLGHRISCERTPQGVGSAITLGFVVSGIRVDMGFRQLWVELYVTPAVADEIDLFTLGTSELGSADVLAY